MQTAIHFWVTGRVQGVYFRKSTQDTARNLGLTGWVRNLPDGRVEGVACGERAALDQLVTWLQNGPELAEVTDLCVAPESTDDSVTSLRGFEIR